MLEILFKAETEQRKLCQCPQDGSYLIEPLPDSLMEKIASSFAVLKPDRTPALSSRAIRKRWKILEKSLVKQSIWDSIETTDSLSDLVNMRNRQLGPRYVHFHGYLRQHCRLPESLQDPSLWTKAEGKIILAEYPNHLHGEYLLALVKLGFGLYKILALSCNIRSLTQRLIEEQFQNVLESSNLDSEQCSKLIDAFIARENGALTFY